MATVLSRDDQIIEHWGVIADGAYVAEYQTRQPDPSHWIAVGLVTPAERMTDRSTPRLLVGSGKTEEAAILDLELRLAQVEAALVS